jgi:TonB family protein
LTASLAAEQEPSPSAIEVAADAEQASFEARQQQRKEDHQARTAITRVAAEEESTLRLLEPVEPVIVIIENAAMPVLVGGLADRNDTSREAPPVGESAASDRPPRRQFRIEPAIPSAASIPAPSSVAASGVDVPNPPQTVLNPPPVYPPEALAAGRTGRVIVRAKVAADGSVSQARLQRSSGVASLDRAALAAVRGWRFSSAEDVDAPPRRVDVPIDFVIRRPADSESTAGR